MLQVIAGKAPQDGLGLCCSQAEGCGILDHLIVLVFDQLPVNGLAQDGLQMLILGRIPSGSEPFGTIDACRVRLTPFAPAAQSRHEHEVAPQQPSLTVCRQGGLLQVC